MARRPQAKRYAQALFQLALEKGEMERWQADLQAMGEALQGRDFDAFLRMPRVTIADKMRIIRGAFPQLNPLAHNLMGLLASRGMVDMLPSIREEYGYLVDQHHGLERAEVVSAVPLEDRERERLERYLHELTGRQIVLTAKVEPGIVAGLVARVGDRLIDGSTRTRLQAMRKSLVEEAI